MVALLAALALAGHQSAQAAIVVRVAAEQRVSAEGFVEPIPKIASDAVAELAKQLRKHNDLSLAQAPSKAADIEVRLTGIRFDSEPTGGAMAFPAGNMVFAVPTYAHSASVRVQLVAGDYRKEIVATRRSWKEAVSTVVKEAAEWISANKALLLERRQRQQ
jgi:hypothetical protein